MSELRQCRITGRWSIIAPERGIRPRDFADRAQRGKILPALDPNCPFCPGHEDQLPRIIAEARTSKPPGWQVRVVPNKYPIARPLPDDLKPSPSRHRRRRTYGHHEVVIESPRHDADPAFMCDAQITAVVELYRKRFRELVAMPKIKSVILFRNRGDQAGASLHHPHAQLVALDIMPPWLSFRSAYPRKRDNRAGPCATCAEVAVETEEGCRVVEATPSFLAFIPFAASVPFEIWIVPRHHQASFAAIESTATPEFGILLRNVLQRLALAHDSPPYNFVVDSFEGVARTAVAHWRLRIVPDLVTWGGFELGTAIPINPSSPEKDAETLRGMPPNATPPF